MTKKAWKKVLFDRRSKKLQKKKHTKRHNKNHMHIANLEKKAKSTKYVLNDSIYKAAVSKEFIAPEIFSIIENTNETISYFNEIAKAMLKKIPETKFVINSKNVKKVTVDALIYLIVLFENMRITKIMRYSFCGNLPKGESAKLVYSESGFLDYVNSKNRCLTNSRNNIRIRSGNRNEPYTIKEICDFIKNELKVEIKDILFVSKILGEVMSNSYYHAYPDKEKEVMYSKWYLYAEHVDKKIRIIFADTGKGITGTVRRKVSEKIRELLVGLKDEDLLYFAFQPDDFIRTETNEIYRGNGLPGIKDIVEKSPIESFTVFSGRGEMRIDDINGKKKLTRRGYLNKIYGTIYVFEFSEKGINKWERL